MAIVLAIGAHPDDIEIDCAGTILREVEQGNKVYFFIATNGDKGGEPNIRRSEAEASAELLGVNQVLFGDLEDCMLRYTSSLVSDIISIVRNLRPEKIYSHCANDISPDHTEIGKATVLASSMVPQIFTYRGSPQNVLFRPNFFVNIERQMATKEQSLAKFTSQNAQDRFGLDYITANAVYYGRMSMCGIQYAEAFETVRHVLK